VLLHCAAHVQALPGIASFRLLLHTYELFTRENA